MKINKLLCLLGTVSAFIFGIVILAKDESPWLIIQVEGISQSKKPAYVSICGTEHIIQTELTYLTDSCEGSIYFQDAKGHQITDDLYITFGIQQYVKFNPETNEIKEFIGDIILLEQP